MIEIVEVSPLPQVCADCPEAKEMGLCVDAYCYNCDYALERFKILES